MKKMSSISVFLKAVKLAILGWMINLPLYGQSIPDIVPWLASNNVAWNVPGPTSSQSMPLGNGDIGINVWVETNGAVDFYIGKTDAWGDSVQGDQGLMKVGGVRLTMNPNPLSQGPSFSQILMLHEGQIQITEGSGANSVVLLIWVDANNPIIRAETTSGGTPVSVQASLLDWRLGSSNPGIASPDVVLTGQTNYIGWYHRNSPSDDSHVANWTFGALIQGTGMTNTSSTNLTTAPMTYQLISVYPLTTRAGTASQWLTQLQSNINQMATLDLGTTRTNSQAWWDSFWHRSWIFATGGQDTTNTTLGYVLQRFVSACAGRGAYPIKFNGSLFVVDRTNSNPGPYTPDGRQWGGQYWMQNTREMYWPMLASGDLDMMPPFFNMYAQIISNNATSVQNYYGHGGSYSAETSPFWGGINNVSTNAVPVGSGSLFTVRYFEGVLELSMMMLDYYDYTGDTNFLANTLIPTTSAGLDFYDQHFGLDGNGKMRLYPVNALETYWDVNDPAPDIAGMSAILPRMLALPTNFVSTAHQSQWTRMLSEVPPLPTGLIGSTTVLLPYTGLQTNQIENGENTQLYAVFPYRIYGLDKPNLALATNSYNLRLFYGLGWADWMPDAIQSAMMGLTSEAKKYTVYAMTNKDPSLKFPVFWKMQNDYMPSEDTGGVAEDALQKMIMQTDGSKIMLLPAWPSGWNAIFKLNAPFNTTVQGTISNRLVSNLIVTPSSRTNDVIYMNGQGSPPAAPTGLTATVGNGQIALSWITSSGAASSNVKRSTTSGSSYAVIANSVPNANYTDTDITNGTTYYYEVSAVNPSGESTNSTQTSATALLAIPGGPAGLIAVPGNAKVTLSWSASSGSTNYNVKRSTTSGGSYATIASPAVTSYIDNSLTNGTTYYYVVSAQNSLGESTNSAQASATPSASSSGVAFAGGTFTNNSILSLIGTPSQEVYGVSLGDATSRTAANGYTFGGYPNSNISFGGSGAYSPGAIFLGGGGTSGDSSFDAVLNNAELGINSGSIILSNLTAGATYNVLFLAADTRSGGEAGRSFNISSGSVTSPSQTYAFPAGTPALGGYILCSFTATNTTQSFINNQSGYGYQLNGILVGKVLAGTYLINMGSIKLITGTNIIINGTSGPAGGVYRILVSTNIAAPLEVWTPIATNYFNATGGFGFTNTLNPGTPAMFYRLISP
jgi:hypothetical protein